MEENVEDYPYEVTNVFDDSYDERSLYPNMVV